MPDAIACRSATGPIRIETRSDAPVKLRLLVSPVAVRVLGTPGPAGRQGVQGPSGPPGPPGNIDTGIVLDGGNF